MKARRIVLWTLGGLVFLVAAVLVAGYLILSSYDFNKFKPEIEKAALDSTGRKLTLAGDIGLKIGLSPALTVADASFENAKWGSRPQMVTVKRLDLQVELLPLLKGEVRVKRLILVEPDVLVETNAQGQSNLAFETQAEKPAPAPAPGPGAPGALPAIQVDKLLFQDIRLAYKDGKTGAVQVVAINELDAAMDPAGAASFTLDGAYNAQPFKASGTLGALAAALDPQTPWPLSVKAQAGGASLSLDGSIKDLARQSGLDLAFSVSGKDLAELKGLAGAALPATGPYVLSGKLNDSGPKAFTIADYSTTLGGSDIGGKVSLDLSGKRPRIKAVLASKTLDLVPYIPEKSLEAADKPKKAETSAPKEKQDRILPDDPFPLDALFLADCSLDMTAAKILLPGTQLTDFGCSLSLENGVLDITSLKAASEQGTLDAKLKAAAAGKNLDLKTSVRMDQLDVGAILAVLGVTKAYTGRMDMEVDLSGKGASARSLMAGLDGFARVSAGEGKLQNKYLSLLGGDLATSMLRMINPLADRPDFTKVNCAIAQFNVEKGLAASRVLVVDTEHMSVTGGGTIDFRSEELNMTLKPRPKNGLLSGTALNLSMSLSELAQPFALGGTMAAPKLELDKAQALMTLGKGVGGALLFGPAGAAAALVGQGGDASDNPCAAALEAARKEEQPAPAKQGVVETAKDTVVDSVKGLGEGVKNLGGGLKNLFGQ